MTEHTSSYLKGHNRLSLDSVIGNYSRTMQGSMGRIGSSVLEIVSDGRDPTLSTYSRGSIKRVRGPFHRSGCGRLRTQTQSVCIAHWLRWMNELCGKPRSGSQQVVSSPRLAPHKTVKGKTTRAFSFVQSQSHPIPLSKGRVNNERVDCSADFFSFTQSPTSLAGGSSRATATETPKSDVIIQHVPQISQVNFIPHHQLDLGRRSHPPGVPSIGDY